MDGRKLKWVQENADRRSRPRRGPARVGHLAAEIARGAESTASAWRARLVGVLEEHAGAELMQRVTVLDVRQGVLRLEVESPAEAYHLRVGWEQKLLCLLQVQLPGAGIHTVRFITARGDGSHTP